MSGLEIERKFLVKKGRTFQGSAFSVSHIRQGYIPAESATVRIRQRDDRAYLTIKSHSGPDGLARYEFEKEILPTEAAELLKLCRGGFIDKHRYLVRSGSHTIEVDEFHGPNEGLVIAEVELQSPDEPFLRPDFLGPEVTADPRFRNSNLLLHPYSEWREESASFVAER